MFTVTRFEEGRAACADRLDLVDAAYISPGKADELRALCDRCPIARACLVAGMGGEAGVWGKTAPHWRSRHGSAHWYGRHTKRGGGVVDPGGGVDRGVGVDPGAGSG